jgi:hypothetical protein
MTNPEFQVRTSPKLQFTAAKASPEVKEVSDRTARPKVAEVSDIVFSIIDSKVSYSGARCTGYCIEEYRITDSST